MIFSFGLVALAVTALGFAFFLYLRSYQSSLNARLRTRRGDNQNGPNDGSKTDVASSSTAAVLASAERIPMPREQFIPLLQHTVTNVVMNLALSASDRPLPASVAESQRQDVLRVCDLLHLGLQLEWRALRYHLLRDFEIFNPFYSSLQTEVFDEARVRSAEQRFLKNFFRVMKKGNFRLLTDTERAFGEAGEFQLRVPTTTQFERLDGAFLRQFFLSDDGLAELPDDASPVCQHLLVFHRGLSEERLTGLMLTEKIDALVARYFDIVARFILSSWLWKALPFTGPAGGSGGESDDERRESASESASVSSTSDTAVENDLKLQSEDGNAVDDEKKDDEETFIERRSITPENVRFGDIFKQFTCVEPAFKEVVILFRARKDTKQSDNARAIHIKTFRNIPLADLEIVFPAKKFSFKLLDFLIVFFVAGLGLFFALTEIITSINDPDMSLNSTVMATCAALIGYGVKTYYDVQYRMYLYRTTVTHSLYHKSSDTNRGVILSLLEAMIDQEWKEACFAYFVLLNRGEEMSERELDLATEKLLHKETDKMLDRQTKRNASGLAIDFEVDDALDKLVRLGLVLAPGPDRYKAVSLVDAVQIMRQKLMNYSQNPHLASTNTTSTVVKPAVVKNSSDDDDTAVFGTAGTFLSNDNNNNNNNNNDSNNNHHHCLNHSNYQLSSTELAALRLKKKNQLHRRWTGSVARPSKTGVEFIHD